jgi:hypothetical protein
MSVQAIGWALAQPATISGTERLVLIVLANYANDANEAWPAIGTIRQMAGLRHDRPVREALRELEAKGVITTVLQGAVDARIRADRRPNLYHLNLGTTLGITRRGCA